MTELPTEIAHRDEPSLESHINHLINIKRIDPKRISDGYHTFGELYEHRITLYMALCRHIFDIYSYEELPVWMSKKHSDGIEWEGWFILGIHTKQGKQITYHLPNEKWEECKAFARVLDKAPEWDGHSPADVINRLTSLMIN